jgi:hypothetical protein
MRRPDTVKVDASGVQGEDAYIEWRRMTWGERKSYQQAAEKGELDPLRLILDHLKGWNWQDAEGAAIPLPHSEGDLDALYDEEITFLAETARKALSGRLEFTLEAEKN